MTITVIVSVHNSKDDLKECMDSTVGQDYKKLEIL